MLKANVKALKDKLPKETKAFSSTCACGICTFPLAYTQNNRCPY